MATLPEGITQAELDRYAKLDRAIKRANEEHKALNAKIKEAFVALGTFVFGSVVIKRTEAASFDSKAAAEKYPYSSHADYYELTPVLVKDKMPEDVRAEFEGKTQRLSIDVAETVMP